MVGPLGPLAVSLTTDWSRRRERGVSQLFEWSEAAHPRRLNRAPLGGWREALNEP
jgi:hypothetical protein